MTTVNFRLQGELEKKVERYIKSGYATSKAEVIRAALTNLGEPERYEDISDDPELMQYLRDLRRGKIKSKIVGSDTDIQKLLR